MKGVLDYGRYNDSPETVGCPRAKSDMTPCIARDGRLALADNGWCVGCNLSPGKLVAELADALGQPRPNPKTNPDAAADRLKSMVWTATQILVMK